MVREHGGAVDAVELASQTGLHVTTVRFHLDALCDDGAIKRTRLARSGAGRPRTGYVAVEERLDYRTLAEILAMELGQTTETRARRAQRAGQKWAASFAGPHDAETDRDRALEQAAVRATVAFTRMGFAPELAPNRSPSSPAGKERTIRLHACPVRDLARSRPEVVCAMHQGLLQGIVRDAAANPAISAHIEPLVEPELCLARLVQSD